MHFVATRVFQQVAQAGLVLPHTHWHKTNSIMGHVAEVKDTPEMFCGSGVVYPNIKKTVELFVMKWSR